MIFTCFGAASGGATATIQILVWAIYAGLVLGFAGAVWSKRVPGAVVKALTRAQAFTPETAKTLPELGLRDRRPTRACLRPDSALRRYVRPAAEERTLPPPGKAARRARRFFSLETRPRVAFDYAGQRWYLPEDGRYAASVRYDTRGCNVQMIVLGAVLLAVLAVALLLVLPHLADFYTAALDGFETIGK